MRSLIALLAGLGLAACGATTAQHSLSSSGSGSGVSTSGSTGHATGLTAVASANGSGASSGTAIGATVSTATGTSGTTGAATNSVGATVASATVASVSSAAGTSGTVAAASSSSGTGQCVPNGVAPGAGGAALCCSGMINSGGFCTAGTSSSSSGTGTVGSGSSSGGTNICTTQNCTVYAQTATDLYSINPTSLAQTHVGTFSGDLSGELVYDIAVRADGLIYAITATDLYSVDPTSCVGTHIAALTGGMGFNGLTFTLAGTLLAADNMTGDVDSIDPTTGIVSTVGNYGSLNGTQLYSSGDLVALSNGVIYATATDSNTDPSSNPDVLVTLDPTNSYAATVVGSTGYFGIYGLAYWAGVVYGFDDEGDSLSIDPTTGIATLITNNAAYMWFGAGTTPNAPVIDH